jgi:phage terminase small subunit
MIMKRKIPELENILEKTEKRDKNTLLTPFEAKFAQEWVVSMDNRKAYLAAGGEYLEDQKELSKKASKVKNTKPVLYAIDALLRKAAKKAELDKDEVLTELMRTAFADPRQFFNEDGTLKNIDELTISEASAIKSIEVVEQFEGHGDERHSVGFQKTIKFNDKLKALELLCKNLGILQSDLGSGNTINTINLNLKVEEAKKLGIGNLKKLEHILDKTVCLE